MTAKEARSRLDLVSALVVGAFGIFTLILGSWAIVDTTSFYDNIATFPPYNRHFLHDIGAFQIGLGTALALAVVWRSDAILAALGGGTAGALAHGIVHITDEELGGRSSDPYALMLIAIVLLATFGWRLYARYGAGRAARP